MTTKRNPEDTRKKILNAAFNEMHRYGYQGMRIDQVLKNIDLKKGALYYHFASKQALAYAVLEEYIQVNIHRLWVEPLQNVVDPLDTIYEVFAERNHSWSDEFFTLGCPLNNLAQEMSPIHEGFRERIEKIFLTWQTALAEALKKGQAQGIIDKELNTNVCALFILASMEGALGMAKNQQRKAIYFSCCQELRRYLETLRVQ
ncbi:MAG: TetR/AcrR family transcriptional regulator, transcriptional repressor for nem operon [Methyloprofundus sp.]|nr:MAG: TetR/AcrR family transcriptional regulator, transcriptional repressor for nem operon [Methyloprofundus sp.]